MSISALSHQIDAEYEFVGKTIFEHYTYLSDRDPATYFPGMPAGPTAQATQAFNADYKNLTDVQAIVDQMLADSLITSSSDMDFLINYHEDMMEQVDNGSIRSFGNLWYFLHEKEQQVESDPHLTDEEKELLLCLSSAVRNTLKYAYVTGQVEDRGFLDNCLFGIKVKCWLKVGLSNLLKITGYYLLIKKSLAAAAVSGGASAPLVVAYVALLKALRVCFKI